MVIFHSYVSLPAGNLVGLYDIDLVGGIPTPSEKYEFVSWDDCSQYMDK